MSAAASVLRSGLRTAPNILTGLRILGAPAAALWFVAAPETVGPKLLVLALVATDALDGWLARRFGAVSPLGAALDPLADKALTLSLLAALLWVEGAAPLLVVPAAAIALREIGVTALRARRGWGGALAVSQAGKLKTTLQFAALLCLMAAAPGAASSALGAAGLAMLWAAAALTLWSGVAYARAARREAGAGAGAGAAAAARDGADAPKGRNRDRKADGG